MRPPIRPRFRVLLRADSKTPAKSYGVRDQAFAAHASSQPLGGGPGQWEEGFAKTKTALDLKNNVTIRFRL